MQTDSLTKLHKISKAKEITCITDVISVEQSVFIINIFAMYMWHGKMLPEVLLKYSLSTLLYKTATYRIVVHVLKLSLQQNSIKVFMVQNSV
jgi:hypothetical protein